MIGSTLEQALLHSMFRTLTRSGIKSIDRGQLSRACTEVGLTQTNEDAEGALHFLEQGEFIHNGDGRHVRLSGSGLILGLGLRLPEDVAILASEVADRISLESAAEDGENNP